MSAAIAAAMLRALDDATLAACVRDLPDELLVGVARGVLEGLLVEGREPRRTPTRPTATARPARASKANGHAAPEPDGRSAKGLQHAENVFRVLAGADGPVSMATLVSETGIAAGSLYRALERLIAARRITKVSRGMYEPA